MFRKLTLCLLLAMTMMVPAVASAQNYTLLNYLHGWADGTTGGYGGTVCHVTNIKDSGPGSLRACLATAKPVWVVFDISGTIILESTLDIGEKTTIDGSGQDIVIKSNRHALPSSNCPTSGNWPMMRINSKWDIIIANLTFDDYFTGDDCEGDAIEIRGQSAWIWIGYNQFTRLQDGAVDVVTPATSEHLGTASNITISWNRIMQVYQPFKIQADYVTFAWNWCKEVGLRCPMISKDYGTRTNDIGAYRHRAHSYNNLINITAGYSTFRMQSAAKHAMLIADFNYYDNIGSADPINAYCESGDSGCTLPITSNVTLRQSWGTIEQAGSRCENGARFASPPSSCGTQSGYSDYCRAEDSAFWTSSRNKAGDFRACEYTSGWGACYTSATTCWNGIKSYNQTYTGPIW